MTDEGDIDGVWLTCAELARRRNVSRAAITKRVNQLEQDGKITTRREGRSRLVELATFDRAIGETGDAFKEASAETKREVGSIHKPLRDAQTERARYEAKMKGLDLAERQRDLLPIKGEHGIEAALVAVAIVITREIEKLANIADEIAIATARDGVAGARRILKEEIRKCRSRIADALNEVTAKGREAEAQGPIHTEIDFPQADYTASPSAKLN
jgi:DNA-binding transcriptional ArsR family regulator